MSRTSAQSGITLIETMVGAMILGIALLAQVSLLVSNTHLAEETQARSETHVAARQFMERLRAEEDWAGLYDRLRLRLIESAPSRRAALLKANDQRILRDLTLADGRTAWRPETYVTNFESLADFGVLIDVPVNPTTGAGQPLFREDIKDDGFGLPADLNGDGVVDGTAREGDYLYLPIRVTFLWAHPVRGPQQMRLTTWLRGER